MVSVNEVSIDWATEQFHKPLSCNSRELPYISAVQVDPENASPRTSKDESFDKQCSRMAITTSV